MAIIPHGMTFVMISACVLACTIAAPVTMGTMTTAVAAGSYRKDFYLSGFKEQGTVPPTDGGRVHVVITNSRCTDIKTLTVNGQNALNLPSPPPPSRRRRRKGDDRDSGHADDQITDSDDPDFTYFDWSRLHTDNNTGVVWLSFHSRNKQWLDSSPKPSLKIEATDGTGTCFQGPVALNPNPTVTASSIITRKNGAELLVHLRASGSSPVQVSSISVNGVAAGGGVKVDAGQTAIVVVPMSPPLAPGSIWAVSYEVSGETVAYGGRALPEYFPILVWPHSKDCPVLGVPNSNGQNAAKFGINSVKYDGDTCNNVSPAEAVADIAKSNQPVKLSIGLKDLDGVQNQSAVASVFIGDEVDGQLNSNLRDTTPAQANQQYPALPTYQGGKTNANIGAYAGITDIQGMDAYIGSCAPTIVPVIHLALPLSYPYQYLKNARNNHMPHQTWLYSQWYSEAWSYQANENEIVAQIAMTVTAGGKGVMLFQYLQQQIDQHMEGPIKNALRAILAQGEVIRTGDVGGAIISSSDNSKVMVEAIRTPEKLLLVAVNMNAGGYSNLLCHTLVKKHWTFQDEHVKSIKLALPAGLKLGNAQEQVGDTLGPPAKGVDISYSSSGTELKDLQLDAKGVVRFFVFDVAQDV